MISLWYSMNVEMLRRLFPDVGYDDVNFSFIRIRNFPLPSSTFRQSSTNFLIMSPGQNIELHSAYKFYLNKGLIRTVLDSTNHIFDEPGYNDLSHLGWARFSFHLESFRPTWDVISGDTLLDVTQSAYNYLASEW